MLLLRSELRCCLFSAPASLWESSCQVHCPQLRSLGTRAEAGSPGSRRPASSPYVVLQFARCWPVACFCVAYVYNAWLMDSISCPILWPRFLCEPLLRRGTPVSHAGSKTQCGLADRSRPQGPWRGRHSPELHARQSVPGTCRISRDRSHPHSEWTEDARVDQARPEPLVSRRASAYATLTILVASIESSGRPRAPLRCFHSEPVASLAHSVVLGTMGRDTPTPVRGRSVSVSSSRSADRSRSPLPRRPPSGQRCTLTPRTTCRLREAPHTPGRQGR